jgi:hypothetical protein
MEKRANSARSPVRPETKDDDEHEHEHEHKHDEERTMALNTYRAQQTCAISLMFHRSCFLADQHGRLFRPMIPCLRVLKAEVV